MAPNPPVWCPASFGPRSNDHRTPFHRSAKGCVHGATAQGEFSEYVPTAMQPVLEVQDTPFRLVWFSPCGLGSGSTLSPFGVLEPRLEHPLVALHGCQRTPSHRAPTGPREPPPIATHALLDVQETARRSAP